MKQIPFRKYQGTGNDFIMINQMEHSFLNENAPSLIQRLCDRRFGIGADGLILLQPKDGYDFEMNYFNADGHRGSMCGNGARCTVAFARSLGLEQKSYHFFAPDGAHRARLSQTQKDWIEIEMTAVEEIEQNEDFLFLDTGSPHYIRLVEDPAQIDIEKEGRRVRYNERFKSEGTNVNFVSAGTELPLIVHTYERGVEAETLSCGTGVTAAAIAYVVKHNLSDQLPITVPIQTKGGQLEVRLDRKTSGFCNIWLCGPAVEVFRGHLSL